MSELTKVETKEESSAIVKPPTADLVVIATTPIELAGAQSQLITWFEQKVALCKAELADAEENLTLAQKRKWRTSGWVRRVTLTKQQVAYYEKAKMALEAGYCIVPDFPVEVIAIRTTAKNPRKNTSDRTWQHSGIRDQETNSPPAGEGKYVSPDTVVERSSYEIPKDGGKVEKHYVIEASEFLPPDFPYKLVKPKILDDTSKAMALKIFDEICVVSKPRRAPDPIVVGRIKRTIGTQQKILSFMVSWWIDAGDL